MPGNNRGRGHDRNGKGPYRGRGRGKDGFEGTGRGVYHTLEEMGEVHLIASSNQLKDGTATPSGRGRGSKSNSRSNTPRGRGRGNINHLSSSKDGVNNSFGSLIGRGRGGLGDQPAKRRGGIGDSPRGRGRGRGFKLRPDAPLSALLFQERPLLRPIKFVPSVHTRVLFQEEEEIFQAVAEEVGEEEQSHVPTADRVLRVFSGGNIPRMPSSPRSESDVDELIEIDFHDMGKLAEIPALQLKTDVNAVEEKFTGIRLGAQSTAEVPGKVVEADTITSISPSKVIDNDGKDVLLMKEPIMDSSIASDYIYAQESVPLVQSNHGPQEGHVGNEHDGLPLSQSLICHGTRVYPTESAEVLVDNHVSHTLAPTLAAPQALQAIEDKAVIDGDSSQVEVSVSTSHSTLNEAFEGFYIDTKPSQVNDPHQGKPRLLEDDDDEVIVYVAPHPGRVSSPFTSSVETLSLPSTSVLTGTTALASTSQPCPDASHISIVSSPSSTSIRPQHSPRDPAPAFDSVSFSFMPTPKKARVFSSRSKDKAKILQRRQQAHATRRQLEQRALFGSFGAMMEEAKLRGGSARELDPQWTERRRGDSDVEWGDEDGEEAAGLTGLAEGMDLDPELEMDEEAMKSFVKSMGTEGSRFMTMDDIADGEVMRLEDEDEKDVSSEEDDVSNDEDEDNAIMKAEEMLIAEPGNVGLEDDEETDEDDEDDEDSPRRNFQARLERLRNHSKGKGKKPAASRKEIDEDSEEDDYDYYDRADEDEDFIERIQMMIEENEDIIKGRDRKARNQVFRAVRDGAFDDFDDQDHFDFKPARKNKDKYKDLPPELRNQWRKDREKKAENKRLRQLKRLELAADPMSSKKGGKKGQKAMLAAAKLDPTITVLPNRVIDMTTLVQQIRRFVDDIGGPSSMSLPPTSKDTRKQIHEMALAFNLKSLSKGKGDARYTTLMKTTMTGIFVNEGKVAKIVRRSMKGGGGVGNFSGSKIRGARGGGDTMPRHKEGEEVGKAAPKIGESNIGFKMLTLMGWSEGQGIGNSGGLDEPLTAVMKRSKLGLGASK